MRYPKQSLFITHYLADLIEDLLLQNGLQELHFIVTPQLGQVQAFVLDYHAQLFAVACPQLLDLVEAFLAAQLVIEFLLQLG